MLDETDASLLGDSRSLFESSLPRFFRYSKVMAYVASCTPVISVPDGGTSVMWYCDLCNGREAWSIRH